MRKIRVLRVLEYTYDDAEAAAADMARWTLSKSGAKMAMRSATMPIETVDWERTSGAAHRQGCELICDERTRQVEEEGWTDRHDDLHIPRERGHDTIVPLVDAAIEYAKAGRAATVVPPEANDGVGASKLTVPEWWPWEPAWWKPSDDPIRNLVKSGALIAAEIDRQQRAAL